MDRQTFWLCKLKNSMTVNIFTIWATSTWFRELNRTEQYFNLPTAYTKAKQNYFYFYLFVRFHVLSFCQKFYKQNEQDQKKFLCRNNFHRVRLCSWYCCCSFLFEYLFLVSSWVLKECCNICLCLCRYIFLAVLHRQLGMQA